jgi:hypothetical protein
MISTIVFAIFMMDLIGRVYFRESLWRLNRWHR